MKWSTRFFDVEKLLLAVFCLVFPFGARVVLWQFGDAFFPYNTVFLYATDVVMLVLILLWFVPLKKRGRVFTLPMLAIGAFLGIGFVSAFLSNVPMLSMGTLVRIALFSAFAFFFARQLSILHNSYFVIPVFLSGIFQSFLAWYQFVAQRSMGLAMLGEQLLGPGIAGVAKIDLAGEKIVRAYGTFPHPNILAAFLIMVIFVCVNYFLGSDTTETQNALWLAGIALMLTALVFTFSRSGWLAFGVGSIVYTGWHVLQKKNISLDIKRRIVALGIICASVLLFSRLYFYDAIRHRAEIPKLEDQAVHMRLSDAFLAAHMIQDHRFFGVGPGQFVHHIERYAAALPESWMYQPVHSLYMLIASEYGLLGLIAFLFFIGFVIRAWWIYANRLITPLVILVSVFFLGLFDHYFFTFEQGILLFWLSVAFMLVRWNDNRLKSCHGNGRTQTPLSVAGFGLRRRTIPTRNNTEMIPCKSA